MAQVYLLSYGESVEVAVFQQSAAREKAAFVSLIQKKAHLVLPIDEVRASARLPVRAQCASAGDGGCCVACMRQVRSCSALAALGATIGAVMFAES
jgi:hypothetical protein